MWQHTEQTSTLNLPGSVQSMWHMQNSSHNNPMRQSCRFHPQLRQWSSSGAQGLDDAPSAAQPVSGRARVLMTAVWLCSPRDHRLKSLSMRAYTQTTAVRELGTSAMQRLHVLQLSPVPFAWLLNELVQSPSQQQCEVWSIFHCYKIFGGKA